MQTFSFRRFQSLCDLHRVATHFGNDALETISNGRKSHAKQLKDHLDSGDFSFPASFDQDLKDTLWLWALSPKQNSNAFLTSTAILLMDALNGAEYRQDLEFFWDVHTQDYISAPPKIRSAILYAFKELRAHRLIPQDCNPAPKDLPTLELSFVENLLIPIAKSLTPADVSIIATADRGYDVPGYTRSLSSRLNSPTLELPKEKHFWYASEVIALTSHSPSSYGYIPCTAFILLDAIRDQDMHSKAKFRFEKQWREYSQLPPEFKTAFHSALRYLYENNDHWGSNLTGNPSAAHDKRASISWG